MGMRKFLFGLNLKKVTFEKLGFHIGDKHTHQRLESIVELFARTYNLALDDADPERVGAYVERQVPQEMRGFAHEAAAMGFAVLDGFRISKHRLFTRYAHDVCPGYAYLAYVGGGVAHGAIHRNCAKLRADLDPFSNWLVLDGRGFYHAFFRTEETIRRHRSPRHLAADELRQFDAGIGRGLWFIECGEPARIEQTIESFPAERRAAVWAGVGLACAYAGGVDRATLEELAERSDSYITMLAQGVALAAHARKRGGNLAPHVDRATRVSWGLSALAVDEIAERCIAAARGQPAAWLSFLSQLQQAHLQVRTRKVA